MKKKPKVVKKTKILRKRKRTIAEDHSAEKKSKSRENSIDNDLEGIGTQTPSKRFKDSESAQPSASKGYSKLL